MPANLRPIDERELGVKLAQTLALWPPPDNLAAVMPAYRMALADVPADLVDIALRHVMLNCKWFPRPAEIREPIARLLEQRRRRHDDERERRASLTAQLEQRDLTETEREADRPAIAAALETIRDVLPTRDPPPLWRSDLAGAVARNAALREAADRHRAGILDGTIPNPIEAIRR